MQGQSEAAKHAASDALMLCRAQGDKPDWCICLQSLACISVSLGHIERAARLLAARSKLREGVFAEDYFPYMVRERERAIAEARTQLGEEAFNKAWAEGQAMSKDEMLDYALEEAQAS